MNIELGDFNAKVGRENGVNQGDGRYRRSF
jgi:hypothetical protein